MKITRRLLAFLALSAGLAILALAGAASRPAASHRYLALVGTYTNKTDSKGIYAFEFDADTGKLTAKGLAVETRDPSWLAIHPSGKFVYAANESGKESAISAFALDAQTGKLAFLNQLPALGEDPCYLSFDKSGKYLFVANYTSGNVAVFPILADGKLGEHTALVTDAGPLGPNKQRQEGPHAHWIEPSPDNRFVIVTDLGLDEILVYPFNADTGALNRDADQNARHVKVSPGSGPRHLVFLAERNWVFSVNELTSTVTWFLYDPLRGWLNELTSATMLPKGISGRNDAAEIAVHPDGKWLFASNRGHDTIALFAADSQKGILRKTGDFPTGGKEPRHFAIDPTGHFLLAENQHSNSIVVFSIDQTTGALKEVSRTDGIPSPVCLVFLPTP